MMNMGNSKIPNIEVMPHHVFDDMCIKQGINDDNVEKDFSNTSFISIIGTEECLRYYLEEDNTKHWFKQNHKNVINLEFDDISVDEFEWQGHVFKGMNMKQAEELYHFIKDNVGNNFFIHCRAGRSRSMAVGVFIKNFYNDIYKSDYPTLFEGFNREVYRKLSRVYYKEEKIYCDDSESKENS